MQALAMSIKDRVTKEWSADIGPIATKWYVIRERRRRVTGSAVLASIPISVFIAMHEQLPRIAAERTEYALYGVVVAIIVGMPLLDGKVQREAGRFLGLTKGAAPYLDLESVHAFRNSVDRYNARVAASTDGKIAKPELFGIYSYMDRPTQIVLRSISGAFGVALIVLGVFFLAHDEWFPGISWLVGGVIVVTAAVLGRRRRKI